MTPKEKATELYNKYFLLHESSTDKNGVWIVSALNKGLAKKCALITVDKIISEYQSMLDTDSIIYIQNEITYVIHKLVYW